MAVVEHTMLGSGTLYMVAYSGTIPADATIEVAGNKIGTIKGGASVSYKPNIVELAGDNGVVIRRCITSEEVTFKSGILALSMETLQKLCDAGTLTDNTSPKTKTLKIGGQGRNGLTSYIVRFVHLHADGNELRVTVVGTQDAGFSMAWAPDKETVVDLEIKAMPSDANGTLLIFDEEYT